MILMSSLYRQSVPAAQFTSQLNVKLITWFNATHRLAIQLVAASVTGKAKQILWSLNQLMKYNNQL